MRKYLLATLCKMPFYAVARGRKTGIFKTWAECEAQVKGFTGAIFKKFPTDSDAKIFILEKSVPSNTTSNKTETNYSRLGKGSAQSRTVKHAAASKETEQPAVIVGRKRYGDHDFPVDADGYVQVYTDGSCENNGKVGAIAGYGVYFDENHPLNVAAPVIGPATNNRGEIQAATRAIKMAAEAGIQMLCINADSKFVIQSVTEWMSGWKKRGWKLSGGGPVKNETDFKKLDAVIAENPSMTIRWNYVPAHTGIHGNERADELAKLGGKSYNKIIPLVRFEPYRKR